MTKSVLIIGYFLSSSIAHRSVCEDLAERLAASGWSVLTTSARTGRLSRLLDMASVAVRRRRDYAVAQVDVYSGLAFLWAEVVCWVLRRLRKPYVVTLHGGNLPEFARRWPQRVRGLLRSAAQVTSPSPYLLQEMRAYRADLNLVPNPVNTAALGFKIRAHPKPLLIWVRAFRSIYNPTMAPEVVARLTGVFPEVRLTMVGPDAGDGSLRRTRRLIERLGTVNHVDLPGGVSNAEVPTWLDQADVFLNTSNVDNVPISVLEAMACGLCVVSTNVGGIPYLLKDGHDALLVPADPDAMAEAVRRVLTEPGLAERLSRNARRKAEQFSWSVVLPKWQSLLTAVAQGPEP